MDRDDVGVNRRAFLATVGVGVFAGCADTPGTTGTDGARTGTSAGTTVPPGTSGEQASPEVTPTERSPDPPGLAGSWPSFGYDLGNTGLNADTAPVAGLTLVWSKPVEGNNTLPEPVVSGAGVYVGSDTLLYAVDRQDGTSMWTRDLGLPTYLFSPAAADGVVYAVARDLGSAFGGGDTPGVLRALDADSGKTLWNRDAPVNSSPVPNGNLVYHAATSSDTGFLRAVERTGGALRWSYEFGSGDARSTSFGVPAFGPDALYATGTVGGRSDPTGHLVALDPTTGDELWGETFPARVDLTPVYSDGSILVASEDGTLYSLDAETRSTEWSRRFDKPLLSKPSVGNGMVYTLSKELVTAVDRSSGETVWHRQIAPVRSTITVTPSAVFVGGDDMDVFDSKTGARLWQREIDGYSGAFGVPVIVNGYMYVGACVKPTGEAMYDNYVYLLG